MRTTLPLVAALALTLCAAPAVAQSPPDRVDEYIRAEMARQRIPGLALAIVRNGEVVKALGYGLANIEHNVPVTPATIFQSGSVGKQFTATLVMMLAQERRLHLDDPIGAFFQDPPPTWNGITVRHLLTHTAGISNKLYDQIDMRHDYTEEQLYERIAALPLDFPPGDKWNYSNPGYVLLGMIIRRVSGKFYGDLLQERIFAPLGMTSARVISEADIVPNRADGYQLVKGEVKHQDWVSPMLNTTADGALYLTVLDLAKWDAALYTERLLTKASLDRMWTPVRLNDRSTQAYGFGWRVAQVNGHRLIEHGGSWQGFKAQISRFTDDKLTVIVFANLAEAEQGRIAHEVAAILEPSLKPPTP